LHRNAYDEYQRLSWDDSAEKLAKLYKAYTGSGVAAMSKAIVLYLHVHQAYRIRHYTIFDVGANQITWH